MDRLEHSIIIVEDHNIEFANSKFLNQFQDLIRYYNTHRVIANDDQELTQNRGSKFCTYFSKLCIFKSAD